jgi:chloride channel 3/4/5
VYVALAVAMAALSAWLVSRMAPYASGSGIPEVKTILSGVDIVGYLGVYRLVHVCF